MQQLEVSANRRFLVTSDGTPFFWLGDTAWCIASLAPHEIDLYLADRAAKGFSLIQINVTTFGRGDYLGRQPFEGRGPPWTSMQMNEAYWAYIDEIVDKIEKRGLYVAIFALWGRNAGHPDHAFFADPARHNYQYGYALGQRYRDRTHVVWCASGEYDTIGVDQTALQPDEIARLRRVAEGIRDGCDSQQLITLHPWAPRSSSEYWHHDDWLSFNMIQTFGHEREGLDLVRHDYALEPIKPVLNGEPGYEDRHRYLPDKGVMDAWHVRLEAYCSLFAGGFGFTYGHVTIWHFDTKPERGTSWRTCLDAPGARQMQHVQALLTSKPILTRVPDNTLIVSVQKIPDMEPGYVVGTRDADHTWAFVYTAYGAAFGVDLGRFGKDPVHAQWYDPRTGHYQHLGVYPSAGEHTFAPPGKPGRGNDWVLVLDVSPS